MRDALDAVEPYADLRWDCEEEWLPTEETFASPLGQLKAARRRRARWGLLRLETGERAGNSVEVLLPRRP
jgi:hypothetical protein